MLVESVERWIPFFSRQAVEGEGKGSEAQGVCSAVLRLFSICARCLSIGSVDKRVSSPIVQVSLWKRKVVPSRMSSAIGQTLFAEQSERGEGGGTMFHNKKFMSMKFATSPGKSIS